MLVPYIVPCLSSPFLNVITNATKIKRNKFQNPYSKEYSNFKEIKIKRVYPNYLVFGSFGFIFLEFGIWYLEFLFYTRRRLRARQPLCGIGVTSRITVIINPADCRARTADSRPEPGPCTRTSISCMR